MSIEQEQFIFSELIINTNQDLSSEELKPLGYYLRKISKEDINLLPIWRYTGAVKIVDSPEQLDLVLEKMLQEKILGFDTETKPSFRKGKINAPSLIQIACSDCVYLIQLLKVSLNEKLAYLLENKRIVKTGVAILDDMRELQKLYKFNPKNIIDIGAMAKSKGLETHGLRNLAANFLGIRISKNARCSNWAEPVLSQTQTAYAATDAWISRELHIYMGRLGFHA